MARAAPLTFERFLKNTEDREISTTMAFVQVCRRSRQNIGKRRPDHARRVAHRHGRHVSPARHGTSAASSTPQDADQLMFYKKARTARSCRRNQRARSDV
jgi:hypothetical protein